MGDIKNDGIVIFCSRGGVMFTSAGEIDVNPKKVRKHGKNRTIVHQVFEQMKEFNDSSYWDDVLTKFSRNIFPRNFKYYNDILRYALKKKVGKREFLIDKENLEQSFEDMKIFLEDKGIVSVIEKKEKLISNKRKDIEYSSWKELAGNQNYAIERYINRLKKIRDLDDEQEANLESVIKFGISSNIFNDNTIVVVNSKIKKIKQLEWDEDEERFFINIEETNIKFPKSKKTGGEGKYSSHNFSGDIFLIKNSLGNAKVSKKWKDFLSDYYK